MNGLPIAWRRRLTVTAQQRLRVAVYAIGYLDVVLASRAVTRRRGDGQAGQIEQVGALLAGVGSAGDGTGNFVQRHPDQGRQLIGGRRAQRVRVSDRSAANVQHVFKFVLEFDPEVMEVVFECGPRETAGRP